MQTLESPHAMRSALQLFLMQEGQDLPAFAQKKFNAAMASVSPVPMMVQAMETLYSVRDKLSPAGVLVMGQAASMIYENGFFAQGSPGPNGESPRAFVIFQVAGRMLGERSTPKEKDDPAPDPAYIESAADNPPLPPG